MEKHPNLKEKLQLLYQLQLNPRITSHSDLGAEVGRSRQAISRWCLGTETTRGNSIPNASLLLVSRCFDIAPEFFALPIEEFEQRIREKSDLGSREQGLTGTKISTSTLPITSVNIFGREAELELLNECWLNPKINVVEIVAFGGAGKSSLVNKWLSLLCTNRYSGAQNIYAWSFYWQRKSENDTSSGDCFIENALAWFGDTNFSQGSPWSKAQRLVNLVRKSKTLLILDGLEPIQMPAGENYGEVTDPAIGLIIKELAAENSGLCMITSRFPVADLQALQDQRVCSLNLSGLSKKAGIEYLEKSGLWGTAIEFENAVETYSGHALCLSLLAGYLSTVHDGELSCRSQIDTLLDEEHSRGHVEKILNEYLYWLEGKFSLQVLRLLAIFDRTTSLSELQTICDMQTVTGLNDKIQDLSLPKWKYALRELAETNLISLDSTDQDVLIDSHPLVKEWIGQQLKTEEEIIWKKGNEQIFIYLSQMKLVQPLTFNDYELLFKAVHHGVKAEKYDEAFEMYCFKIKNAQFSLFAKGSLYSDYECLRLFFDDKWEIKKSKLREESQFFLRMSAATNLLHLGQSEKAIMLFEQCIDWYRNHNKWVEITVASAQFLSMLIICGELKAAKSLMHEMREIVSRTNNSIVLAGAASFEGYIAFLEGDFELAKLKFEISEKTLTQLVPESPAPFPTVSYYYCRFLLEMGAKNDALERCLKSFAWRRSKSWQVAFDTTPLMAGDMVALGLVFLQLGDVLNAKAQLFKQVELLRASDEALYLPAGLNSRARYYSAVKNYSNALLDLQESIELSKKTGTKFGEWEAHLDMAQLFVSINDFERGRESLKRAKELEGMDQYKFRDSEIQELEHKLSVH